MPPSATPTCPRCGYDLTGAVDAWDHTCPLTGVCSECGLDFEWRRVLNPALNTPRWSFEHTIDRAARRLLATWRHALIPWSFWRQLRMEHAIHPRRLLLYAAAMLLAVHLACALAQGWETWDAASYSIPIMARYGVAPDEKPWVSALQAGVWPYRTYSIRWAGWDVEPYGGSTGIGAICLLIGAPLAMLLLPDTFKMARVRRMHILRGGIYGLSMPAIVIIIVAGLTAFTTSARAAVFGSPPVWSMYAVLGVSLAALLWYALCWWFFVRRYLQLPRGWLVAVLIIFLAILFAVTMAARYDTMNA